MAPAAGAGVAPAVVKLVAPATGQTNPSPPLTRARVGVILAGRRTSTADRLLRRPFGLRRRRPRPPAGGAAAAAASCGRLRRPPPGGPPPPAAPASSRRASSANSDCPQVVEVLHRLALVGQALVGQRCPLAPRGPRAAPGSGRRRRLVLVQQAGQGRRPGLAVDVLLLGEQVEIGAGLHVAVDGQLAHRPGRHRRTRSSVRPSSASVRAMSSLELADLGLGGAELLHRLLGAGPRLVDLGGRRRRHLGHGGHQHGGEEDGGRRQAQHLAAAPPPAPHEAGFQVVTRAERVAAALTTDTRPAHRHRRSGSARRGRSSAGTRSGRSV